MEDFTVLTEIHWDGLKDVQEELVAVIMGLDPSDFAESRGALQDMVDTAEQTYISYLNGGSIPGTGALPHPYPNVAKGVYQRQVGLMSWAVGNSQDFAKTLEDGAEAYDMKENLKTAPRARTSKDGKRYLIIPFRHGSPWSKRVASMPSQVYSLAKGMAYSRRVGAPFTRVSATGYTVPAWAYHWASGKQGRISKKQLLGAGFSEHQASRYAGMVRMGQKGQTSYMTFRVMSENSAPGSWIRPARPAMKPLETAFDAAWKAHMHTFEVAVTADLNRMLFGE